MNVCYNSRYLYLQDKHRNHSYKLYLLNTKGEMNKVTIRDNTSEYTVVQICPERDLRSVCIYVSIVVCQLVTIILLLVG